MSNKNNKFVVYGIIAMMLCGLATYCIETSEASDTTWRHSGFTQWGYDINSYGLNIWNGTQNIDTYSYIISYNPFNQTEIIAINGTSGAVYSDIDAAVVIQYAINQTGGTDGVIFIKPGNYTIDTTLTIYNHSVTVKGAGREMTLLYGTADPMITWDGLNRIQISDMQLQGNSMPGTGIFIAGDYGTKTNGWNILNNLIIVYFNTGMNVQGCLNSEFDNIAVWYTGTAINFSHKSMNSWISNLDLEQNTEYGLVFRNDTGSLGSYGRSEGIVVTSSLLSHNKHNINVSDSYQIVFDGLVLDYGEETQNIQIIDSDQITVDNSYISGPGGTNSIGISVLRSTAVKIINNNIVFNTYYGTILEESNSVLIQGNKFSGNENDILLKNTNYTKILNNDITSSGTIHHIAYLNNNDNMLVTLNKFLTAASVQVGVTGTSTFNNIGMAPYYHSIHSTAPTAYGNGDTYFDSDIKELCIYSDSWKEVSDMSTACS